MYPCKLIKVDSINSHLYKVNVFVKSDEQSQARLTVTDGEIIAIGQNDYQRYYMTKALILCDKSVDITL